MTLNFRNTSLRVATAMAVSTFWSTVGSSPEDLLREGKRLLEEVNCSDCYTRSESGLREGIRKLEEALTLGVEERGETCWFLADGNNALALFYERTRSTSTLSRSPTMSSGSVFSVIELTAGLAMHTPERQPIAMRKSSIILCAIAAALGDCACSVARELNREESPGEGE